MFAGSGSIIQSGWVVEDLDSALTHWLARGAGPFWTVRRLSDIELVYRDRPVRLELSVAWGQFGAIQIELIQQHNEAPSAFRDTYPDKIEASGGAFHHIGLFNHSYDEALRDTVSQGFPCAMQGAFDGARFAYIDTRDAFGCMMELTEMAPGLVGFYAQIEAAAKDWDGSDPIRSL